MTMKNIFKRAHEMAREIKREYPEVDYRTQFGLCLSYLTNEGGDNMKPTPENILKKAKEITEVSPRRWEGQNGTIRYYFNYGNNKTIYFSFKEDGRVEAKANRPGALTEVFQTLESFGLAVVEQKGNWTIWKKGV